jgi:hypothetical protein
MTIVTRPNITNITKYHQISPAATQNSRSENKTLRNQLFWWQYLAIFGNIGQYHKCATLLISSLAESRSLSGIIISVSNHQSVLHIFSLTVVSLCILLNPHDLPSPILTFYPLKSILRSSNFARHRLESASPRIFSITSVANHQKVLPIFSLTVVSLCILLNPCRHRPSFIVHRSSSIVHRPSSIANCSFLLPTSLKCTRSSLTHRDSSHCQRIFTITAVAKHKNVLPIFCLTVVSLCILHRPLQIVAIYPCTSSP